MGLEPGENYIVRVRHEGQFKGWSEWSESSPFSTIEVTKEEGESDGA